MWVIPKTPLTPLVLHALHQTTLCCPLPGLPTLHASRTFCVQGAPAVVNVSGSCQYLSTLCPSQHDQKCIVQGLWGQADVGSTHAPAISKSECLPTAAHAS